jgi:hypothetical protein
MFSDSDSRNCCRVLDAMSADLLKKAYTQQIEDYEKSCSSSASPSNSSADFSSLASRLELLFRPRGVFRRTWDRYPDSEKDKFLLEASPGSAMALKATTEDVEVDARDRQKTIEYWQYRTGMSPWVSALCFSSLR